MNLKHPREHSSQIAGITVNSDKRGPVELQIVETIEDVESIRHIWSSWTTDRDSDIDFCLRFVWADSGIIRPHVVILYRNGSPEAMMVGRLERAAVVSRVGYLKLPGMQTNVLTFASSGFLGNFSAENCEHFVRSILGALSRRVAHTALFQHVDTESPIFRLARKMPGVVSRDFVSQPMPHSLLDLSAGIEGVWSSLSSGARTDVRRKRKKIARDFGTDVKVECFQDSAGLESVIPKIETIASRTYQRAIGVGFKDSKATRERLEFFAERGWLRAYLMTLRDEPCAFWVGAVYGGTFISDYLSFDPKFADYSPGTFMLGFVIEDLASAGILKLNFGGGEGRYKERFSNRHWSEASTYIFAGSVRGVSLNAMRTVFSFGANVLKAGLDRAKLLTTVRKLWRSKLTSQPESAT